MASARKAGRVHKILKMKVSDAVIQKMRAAAEAAAEKAYCPYSEFPVGAAVLTEGHEVFVGCNVENASLGLTMCAERNAVFQAVASGHRKIVAVVIVTPTSAPAPPCGACRQVISEFGNQAEVFSFGKDGNVQHFHLNKLLPEAFGPDRLP
jgi:cytidine deaminase